MDQVWVRRWPLPRQQQWHKPEPGQIRAHYQALDPSLTATPRTQKAIGMEDSGFLKSHEAPEASEVVERRKKQA